MNTKVVSISESEASQKVGKSNSEFTLYGSVFKRALDLVAAILLLIPLSPFLLMIALLIKIDSRGTVFYRQPRHGKNNKIFSIYKFRSMYADKCVVNGGGLQAKQGDARVTKIGRFLRRTSLDELPQIFNVIKGDMSLIGPRPHAVDHNYFYEQHIYRYYKRHFVRPGITGWAQVNGCRGETRRISDMAERVKYDVEYVENRTLWLDIKIALLTIREIFSPRNAH